MSPLNNKDTASILDGLNNGIIILDAKKNILYWNKWIEKRTQQQLEKCENRRFTDVFPETRNSHLEEAIDNAITSLSSQYLSNHFHANLLNLNLSNSLFKSDDQKILIDILVRPLSRDRETCCIIEITDITYSATREKRLEMEISDRLNFEKNLKKSEARYRLLAENSNDIIFKTNDHGYINFVSPVCAELLGLQDTLSGTHIKTLVHPEERNIFQNLFEPKVISEPTLLTHRFITSSGQYIWFESTSKPVLNNESHQVEIVFQSRDITLRKEEEEQRHELLQQLHSAQKMQSLGHLTGGIAHDFNNLLTSIIGYTELLETGLQLEKNSSHSRYLDSIKTSGFRAKDLIEQLLEFAQGKSVQLYKIDTSPVIRNAISLVKSTLPSSIKIHTHIKNNIPSVVSNSTQLEQVLLNLCINAKDAMLGNGEINIKLYKESENGPLCSSCHEEIIGEYVILEVSDNGPGMDQETIKDIFEPFYSTKQRFDNSGLGLSVVHGIVHSHHGHITVHTSRDGTTFKILLPIMHGSNIHKIAASN
ncbi:MAG: PAS domain S-box protein [Gammaproteobacteria bacterium]|nr:PAS domain S-box protein [Gammaproteobacteria bacterium]